MNIQAAKSVAADRAKRENREMLVVYQRYGESALWRHRYEVIPESAYASNTQQYEPKFYVSPKGRVTPVHHHIQQDREGGKSFRGRKRNCPLCHPKKPWL